MLWAMHKQSKLRCFKNRTVHLNYSFFLVCLFVFLTFCNITKLYPKYPVFSLVQDDMVINVPNV